LLQKNNSSNSKISTEKVETATIKTIIGSLIKLVAKKAEKIVKDS